MDASSPVQVDPYATVSAMRIWLQDCPIGSPATILSREPQPDAVRHAWIPQTIGEQIWALWEFRSVQDRLDWEASLSPRVAAWLDRKLVNKADEYEWAIRDENGWIVERS